MNTQQKPTSTFRRRLHWIAVVVLVAIGLMWASTQGSPCKRLASDLDNASAVTASYPYGTEMFYYAASKVADIRTEMQTQGCPLS
jgi:hypothetical protein